MGRGRLSTSVRRPAPKTRASRRRGLSCRLARLVILPALLPGHALPQTAAAPPDELPARVRQALSTIQDSSFSFAQPGYYTLLEFAKDSPQPPGCARDPLIIDDWAALLERPADFRGLPLTVEGVVGHNRAWRHEQPQYQQLGVVWQLELSHRDAPIDCTVICTDDASDIPLGATIQVTGYFVMIRQYYTESRRVRQAALLVARGPTSVTRAAAPAAAASHSTPVVWTAFTVAGTAGLLIAWILLRRATTAARRNLDALRPSGPAPLNLSADLAAWAAEDSPQRHRGTEQED